MLDRAEASLRALMSDAREAKTDDEVSAVTALAKSVAAIRTGRPERRISRDRRTGEVRRKEHRGRPGGIEGRKVERRARRDRRDPAPALRHNFASA